MPKGRRKGGISSLSRFLHSMDPSHETVKGPGSGNGVQKQAEIPAEPMVKRRKIDTTDTAEETEKSWIKKYDETGLVPHYTHLDQVPSHLQKCELRAISSFRKLTNWTFRFFSAI